MRYLQVNQSFHNYQQIMYRLKKDGDFIEFGNSKLKVIHTPGHSNDSICLVGDGNIFSGDTARPKARAAGYCIAAG